MTAEEKINLLIQFDDLKSFSEEQIALLLSWVDDEDEFVRSLVASLLVMTEGIAAEKALLKLAKDEDDLVRIEALDTMAAYPSDEVLCCLSNAIIYEKDELARSYAILSWADVNVELGKSTHKNVEYVQEHISDESSERILLSWYYALYRFGCKEYLNDILALIKSEDYQIRCSVLSLLRDIISNENCSYIYEIVKTLLVEERHVTVIEMAERLLNYI